MVLLSIGYNSGKCDIYDRLSELSSYFKEQGINIGLMEDDSEEYHFIKFIIRDEESSKYKIEEIRKSFNVYSANLLYNIIIEDFEVKDLSRIINDRYYYFRSDEAEDILNRCKGILTGSNLQSDEEYLFYTNRKNKVVNKIYEYLKDNTDFVIEGFTTFRLREFNSELEDIVEKAVEEYLIEREYDEFVKLLRYFVEIQECKLDVANIVINTDGSYCIYDDKSKDITEELLNELFGEGQDNEKHCDDILVSSLITAAPRYIVIHNANNIRNKEITETIKNVFDGKVTLCTGCKLCIKQSPVHKL